VYMTFGTVLGYMSMAADVYTTALQAVQELGVRTLLTVGRRFDRAALPPVPENVRVEAWVDQAEVLAHADVVVCHGGSGTTLAALAAGVPLVLVPLFADQFENARRVAAAGAGLAVETRTPARIAAAIRDLMDDGSYGRRARQLADEMAGYPTAEAILARLHQPPPSAASPARR
jgi:MGT family glycosyltransferase